MYPRRVEFESSLIIMHGSEKNLAHQGSSKSCFSKGELGSTLNAFLKNKKSIKISKLKKRWRLKSRSHTKSNGSNLLNRTIAEISSTRIGGDSARKKAIKRKSVHMTTLCANASSGITGEKSSNIGSKGKVKTSDGGARPKKSKKRRVKRKRQKVKDNVELDETSRLQRRTRYLLIKMKLEQNLIDAYSGEGWKGQSREKIRPEKELLRARKEILKCKLGIRDAIRQLDMRGAEGSIANSVMAPDGSVYHEHILCAKCKLGEASPDNDIILCDGTCNCAFHQKCLDPPLETENIPPGDQGWLCKFCDCKTDILEAMNAHLGTHFSTNSNWQDIFKEEAALPEGGSGSLNPEEEWPSDDSEDDDYDPERNENENENSRNEDNSSEGQSSSSSLSWSFEDEFFSQCGNKGSEYKSVDSVLGVDIDDVTDPEIFSGGRLRRAVDYKKLYVEMFGKDATANEQVSEDEDWGPTKRKRKEKESDAATTLMTLYESEKNSTGLGTTKVKTNFPRDPNSKRTFFRIPPDAVEKLRQAFDENELPSRDVRENLSKELGIDSEKISKWFKNARYAALRSRKGESSTHLHESQTKISTELRSHFVESIITDQVASKDTSSRRNPKSMPSSLKKEQHIRPSVGIPTPSSKAIIDFGDDICLRKQMKLLKAKACFEKQSNNVSCGAEEAEGFMEKVCKMKDKLDKLKQVLLSLRTGNRISNIDNPSVIYVPVAELREKV